MLAAGVGLLVAGCGASGGGEVTVADDPSAALADAAAADHGTVRYAFESIIETMGVRVSGDGLVEPDGDSYRSMTIVYDLAVDEEMREQLEADGQGETLELVDAMNGTVEWISTDGAVYERWTAHADEPSHGGPPPADEGEWLVQSDGPYGSSRVGTTDIVEPLRILDQLAAVTDVDDRGTVEIDGERVRWLSAVVPDDAPEDDGLLSPGTELDVYLDAAGRVRRIESRHSSEARGRWRTTLDYLDHDSAETVEPPPSRSTIHSSMASTKPDRP